MKKSVIAILFILAGAAVFAQKSKKSDILISIDKHHVTKDEFLRIYQKNNKNTIDQKSLEEYLDLFINFKLKVIEAESLGMDTTTAFKRELEGYRRQLAQKYMSDEKLIEEMYEEAYERYKIAIKAKWLMFNLAQNAPPSDTLRVYNLAMDARKRIIEGEDFSDVAKDVSDEQYVEYTGGSMGNFIVFKYPYNVESVAYSLEPGDISMPVRTKGGYAVIQLEKKFPHPGIYKVAHIAIRANDMEGEESVKAAKEKTLAILDSLRDGADFDEMALEHSDDRNSAGSGGVQPEFEPGMFVASFEDAAFKLQKPGDLSEPVKTFYGWHIIKLISKKDIPSYEDKLPEIKDLVERNYERKNSLQEIHMANVKKQVGFKEYTENLDPLIELVDSAAFAGTWPADKGQNLKDVLFVLGDVEFKQNDFSKYLHLSAKRIRNYSKKEYIEHFYAKYKKNKIKEFEEDHLGDYYPEFKHLMQEYHDGILLFELTDEMVWSKAVKDTVGLKAYFEEHKEKYRWDERVVATLYQADDEEVLAKVKKFVKKNPDSNVVGIISNNICDESNQDCIQVEQGKFEKGDNKIIDSLDWNTGFSDIFSRDGKMMLVYMEDILEPAQKELDEARGLVTADYQNYLEKEWIKTLRKKYKIKVNEELFTKMKENY